MNNVQLLASHVHKLETFVFMNNFQLWHENRDRWGKGRANAYVNPDV